MNANTIASNPANFYCLAWTDKPTGFQVYSREMGVVAYVEAAPQGYDIFCADATEPSDTLKAYVAEAAPFFFTKGKA